MAKITMQPLPKRIEPVAKRAGIKVNKYTSAASFEKDLIKFLKRNNVLHLGTSHNDIPRVTPLEYRLSGLTFYILSEGGGKFKNLKANKRISLSIAEPYDSAKDFFGSKGLQAWGVAKVYSIKEHPEQFQAALRKMNITSSLKGTGQTQLPTGFHFRIIEITPDRIKYSNLREGVFHITWERT